MKRLKALPALFLALCSLLLTACVRLDADVTIKTNGKADFSFLYAVMSDDPDSFGLSEDEQDEIGEFGGKYELYNEDGYMGYRVTASDIPLDKLSDNSFFGGDSDSFMIKKNGNTLRFEGSLLDSDDEEELASVKDSLGMYGGYMRFTLHLPTEPNESNATSTSDGGKTLTWDLTKMKSGEKMIAEFTIPGGGFGYLWFICGLVALVLLVVLIVVLLLRRKPAEPVINPAASAAGSSTGAPEGFIYCSKCGTRLPAGTAYCTNCGSMVVSAPTPAAPETVQAPANSAVTVGDNTPTAETAPTNENPSTGEAVPEGTSASETK